jgi:hypothetical protein
MLDGRHSRRLDKKGCIGGEGAAVSRSDAQFSLADCLEPIMKAFAAVLCGLFCVAPSFAAKQYSYFRVGNPNDISTSTTPDNVLMGGGTDVDPAFPIDVPA